MTDAANKDGILPAEKINPSSLTVDEAAALLRIDAETVRRHIAAGLPTDEQGRIHLIEYVAWIVQRLGNKSGDGVLEHAAS